MQSDCRQKTNESHMIGRYETKDQRLLLNGVLFHLKLKMNSSGCYWMELAARKRGADEHFGLRDQSGVQERPL